MTYQHATSVLNFPDYVAIPAAILVEILGFSAVSTFLAFWFHNKKSQANYKRAPIEVIVIAFVFYLSLIIFSNVLLDAFPNERWAEITVRALFTLQTIPAALIVAVRTQHRDLLSEIRRERLERLSENLQKVEPEVTERPEPRAEITENFPKDWRKLRPLMTSEQVVQMSKLTSTEIKDFSRKNNVDERTVTNWRTYANKELENK